MNKPAKGLKKSDPFAMEFQSTTWDTNLKTLFSKFHSFNIMYNYPGDFQRPGSFVAIQNKRFAEIAKERLDFGSLPNRGEVDPNAHDKVLKAFEDKRLKPDTNWTHLMYVLNWFIGTYFMLLGEMEHVDLVWGMFDIFTTTEGEYAGREALNIKGLNDKSHHVSVKNPVRRMNNGNWYIIACPEQPLTCVVHWVKKYKDLCRAEDNDRFYVRKARGRAKKVTLLIYFLFFILIYLTHMNSILH